MRKYSCVQITFCLFAFGAGCNVFPLALYNIEMWHYFMVISFTPLWRLRMLYYSYNHYCYTYMNVAIIFLQAILLFPRAFFNVKIISCKLFREITLLIILFRNLVQRFSILILNIYVIITCFVFLN